MSTEPEANGDPGFAPADLTDGRRLFDWSSRWPKEAQDRIRVEAIYCFFLFISVPLLTVLVANGDIGRLLTIPPTLRRSFQAYSYAALGGLLGGVLFDLKWLYHTVARGTWNIDRLLWRLFIPLISSGLAVAIILLARSGTLPLVDVTTLDRSSTVMGVSFIVGYFSDNTIAAMARFAENVFGKPSSGNRPSRHENQSAIQSKSSSPSTRPSADNAPSGERPKSVTD